MEPHPIPQNVTSFEFHLVGDMTLKQFLYLGAGLGMAYLLYAAAFYAFPIVILPLICISVLLGVSFAFLPIFDRPLDHWVKAFFTAVYSPTKGAWKTRYTAKKQLDMNNPLLKNRLQLYLSSLGISTSPWENTSQPVIPMGPRVIIPIPKPTITTPPPPINKEIEKTEQKVNIASSVISKAIINIENQQTMQKAGLPSNRELAELVEMARQAQVLQAKIADTEKLIAQMAESSDPAERARVAANLQHLIQQTEDLYHKTSAMSKITAPVSYVQPQLPTPPQPAQPPPKFQVKPLPTVSSKTLAAQKVPIIALTSTPNVINGIVSDETGNYLENVITIIHNKDGIPVRALKTNKLGQFVGSTSLPAGVYTITLEKEGYSFQTLQVGLDNAVMTPIMITAGKGGQSHDQ